MKSWSACVSIPKVLAWAVAMVVAASAAHGQTATPQNAEAVTWDSIVCRLGRCEPLKVKGYLFIQPGDKAVVILSHGSVGVDARIFERVDRLREVGIASLVPEHWASRGIGEVLGDLKGAPAKGASELNMAFDIYTAAAWLRADRGFAKVGALGASYGGGAQITVQQDWARAVIEKTVAYHHKRSFVAKPLDAQVSMYGFCGYRNALRDRFDGTPILFINGDKDEMTPAKLCEQLVPWMNERGGNASMATLKGAYHAFDARERAAWVPKVKHMGKCDLMVDAKGTTNLTTGHLTADPDFNASLAKAIEECATAWGYTSGNSGDPQVADELWLSFLRKRLR